MSVTDPDQDALDEQPRRGARVRKQVERYGDANDDEEKDEDEEEDEEEETPQVKKPARTKKAAAAGKGKPAGTGKAPVRKRRQGSHDLPGDRPPPEGFKNDSPLFNALLSPDIAIQPLAEEWVETYQSSNNNEDTERAAVGELVLFFVRCCGVSSIVDEDEAMDRDGVGDVVERIQDESVKTNAAMYPLIVRSKNLKPFKPNLNSVISHLISTLSLTPHLYDTDSTTSHSIALIPLLLTWLSSMSTSPLRPIRHTSTYIALKVNSALCDVAAAVGKDLSVKQRQKEAEAKKGTGKRLKDAEAKVKEVHERKTKLEGYMQEIFTVIFVHRVRDADPAIRADCMRELGAWVKRFPERYVNPSFLSYFSRGCNDPDTSARTETVKALAGLFSSPSATTGMALRLMPRLVEMALRDFDTSVRVNALNVITAIDKTGLLQDEDETEGSVRDDLASLIFDAEPRVRKAVAGFVKGLWQEKVETLSAGLSDLRGQKKKRADAVNGMDRKLACKALANLLVSTSKAIAEPDNRPSTSNGKTTSTRYGLMVPMTGMTRAEAAVEALWAEIDVLNDWQALVEYLLLDHSSNDLWLLEEEEENFMLQVLVACIKREDEDDETRSKSLMQILPRLFTKHQADIGRIAGIFTLIEHINLSLYLDMRMVAQYEALWDDVTKQFLLHHDSLVLSSAVQAINHLVANTAMATINSAKLIELDEALFTSLRDAVGGNDDVATMSIDDDQRATIEAVLTRLSYMYRSRDMVDPMEDEEGGQSSGWTIVCAFESRASMGFREEAKMIESAMQIIFLHVTWLLKRGSDKVKERRDEAEKIFERHGVTNPAKIDSVRRQAYIAYLNMHVLFSPKGSAATADSELGLEIVHETQHKLEGALSAFVERYAQDVEESVLFAETPSDLDELQFIQLVSAFIGAIRCGVIDVDHAKEPLAHFGRFGGAYNTVVKKLVDVLRDEGIYNSDATTVCHVAGEALKSSFNLFIESDNAEPGATIGLAKLINTSFIVQGNHFTILRQIHPDDVRDMHTEAIKRVFGQITNLVRQEKTAKAAKDKSRIASRRGRFMSFFKALVFAIGPMASMGRPALEVLEVLDAEVKKSGLQVETSKAWDGFNAYRRKLQTIAEKDPVTAERAKRADKDAAAAVAGAEGDEVIDEDEDEEEQGHQLAGSKRSRVESQVEDVDDEEAAVDVSMGIDQSGLNLDLDDDGNLIDLDDGGDVSLSQQEREQRERSVSVEPGAKRRKVTKRF